MTLTTFRKHPFFCDKIDFKSVFIPGFRPKSAVKAPPSTLIPIESIVAANCASIARALGDDYDWNRFLSLFLKEAILIHRSEQSGGIFRVLSPPDFVDWITSVTAIGVAGDRGYAEEGYHNRTGRYGDVANVMSSYQKHFWGEETILGRGINSFQLVWSSDQWWIAGIA